MCRVNSLRLENKAAHSPLFRSWRKSVSSAISLLGKAAEQSCKHTHSWVTTGAVHALVSPSRHISHAGIWFIDALQIHASFNAKPQRIFHLQTQRGLRVSPAACGSVQKDACCCWVITAHTHTHTHWQNGSQHYLIFLNIILKWFYIRVFMEMEETFKPI